MLEGPLAALDAIDAGTGERSVNAVGYCLGGTLLASTLGYLAAHGDDRIASATDFVTLVDFTDVGDMAVFIDEDQLPRSKSACGSVAIWRPTTWRHPSTCCAPTISSGPSS